MVYPTYKSHSKIKWYFELLIYGWWTSEEKTLNRLMPEPTTPNLPLHSVAAHAKRERDRARSERDGSRTTAIAKWVQSVRCCCDCLATLLPRPISISIVYLFSSSNPHLKSTSQFSHFVCWCCFFFSSRFFYSLNFISFHHQIIIIIINIHWILDRIIYLYIVMLLLISICWLLYLPYCMACVREYREETIGFCYKINARKWAMISTRRSE